uniref:Anoctamin n=1 Tax=Oreochromis niloticus TaxID=8128 RepID=A0A669D2V2_ORENI
MKDLCPDTVLGPYFSDGMRRVDYVLTYHIQKSGSTRRRSSRFGDNNFIQRLWRSLSTRSSRAPLQPKEDPEVAAQEHQTDYHEDDKRFKRDEFEENLRKTGLELEKDEEVYEVKQGSNVVEKIRMFIHKVTAPLHPKVNTSRSQCEKPLSSNSLIYIFVASDIFIDCSQLLYEQWASYSVFYKYQPIGLIRKYFGEKVGLYFAWLGVYTQMLIPAAIIGVIVFLYGCATVDDNIPSMEICDPRNNITMCPLCDQACSYWKLVTACGTARASHLFDNAATVFFSVFMALWAVLFMEHWKRRQMRLNYVWDLTGFGEEEEDHNRAEYEFRVMQKKLKQEHSGLMHLIFLCHHKDEFNLTGKTHLINSTSLAALHMSSHPVVRYNIRATVKTTAAIINLIIIIVLDEIYGAIARWLTRLEVPKTDKSFEERLIFKTFILKFVNAFTPIVYLAFFRGRLVGRPGNYLYVVGSYRMEECAHAGCLMELCIQLCITMLGKQLIQNNLFEIGIPKLKKMLRKRKSELDSIQEQVLHNTLKRYEKDQLLGPFVGLNPEYMEMIIQFGMVTLFVASFPLAPLFALLNNIIEIRLDAKKFVTELRRPIAAKAKDIGIWYNLLRGLSKVAVIVNAFVIAFTSDFIPRLVYQYMYSPDGTLHGFVNHTLSYFNVTDFDPGTEPLQPMHLGYKVSVCRYKDYRDPPWSSTKYELSKEFWAILAARLAFVIVFQNVVMLMSDFVDWLIPDIPKDISLQIHKEKILMVELFMKEEQGKRFAARDNQDNCTIPLSANQSPPQPRSRPVSQANCS